MPEPEIVQIANQFSTALHASEVEATRAMAQAYRTIEKALVAGYTDLWQQTEVLRKAGQEITASQVLGLERYQELMAQTQAQLRKAAALEDGLISDLQADALEQGQLMAQHQLQALIPAGVPLTFNQLPITALQFMVGFLQDGSPLAMLLNDLGVEAAGKIGELLIKGLGLGWNPRKVARMIRDQVGMLLTRAMRIARTEMLRAWRKSTIEGYRNQPVIKGYRRHAQKDTRTCAACLLEDGAFYETLDQFDDHVQGRCAVVPVTRSWAELGFPNIPDTNPQWQSGRDWLLAQNEAAQREVLGGPIFDAWQGGDIALEDMKYLHRSDKWGDAWQAASLKRALASAAARRGG